MRLREPAQRICLQSRGSSWLLWLALGVVFRLAGLARRPAYLGVGIAMVAYAVGGWAGAVGRAGDRHDGDLLPGFDRRAATAGPANTLSLAAIGTLAVNPSYLFDVGLPAFVSGDRRR